MEGIEENTDGAGFDMSMLMGQQPQLFGNYGQDGTYNQDSSAFQGQYYQDDTPLGGNEDSNDPKRRRIARVRRNSFFFFFFFFAKYLSYEYVCVCIWKG